MTPAPTFPGVYFTLKPRPQEPSPLRSDVAGFIGRTRRGPAGVALRVEGWRSYVDMFGGLARNSIASYALRGYFENGGEVAWVLRLGGATVPGRTARSTLTVGALDGGGNWSSDSPSGFSHADYRVLASSPGKWANGTQVTVRYDRDGGFGAATVDVVVLAPDEPPEYFSSIPAAEVAGQITARSRLIVLEAAGPAAVSRSPLTGPRRAEWTVTIETGEDPVPERVDYLAALEVIQREPEIALICLPDLSADVKTAGERQDILYEAISQAEAAHDRMVLLDAPPEAQDAEGAVAWLAEWKAGDLQQSLRAAALYHPGVRVPDPLAGVAQPLRCVPPSGHVAGVISRLDRERGAHYTPANAEVLEAVDISRAFDRDQQVRLNAGAVNLLRCVPGRGIFVWGGRTAAASPDQFVAHRRLIHRLVRAIRRVAEPLVFDVNGPELWLTLVRGITTILLEAWRGGGLKGARPEEAFRVRCDETTNPADALDNGRVVCEVSLAPATPMEFIVLRVEIAREGALEVFES